MKKSSNNSSVKTVTVVAVGATLAAAAGAYFLYGTKQGKQTRTKIKGWTLKAKGEVLEKMEQLKEVNEETYNKVVDVVMKKYEAVKSIDSADVAAVAKELRKHWSNIKKHISGAKPKSKPKAKASVQAKKAASKTRI